MFHTPQKKGNGHSAKEPRCPSYKAFFRLTSESRVGVFFLKRHLPAEVIQQHFGKGHFEMPFSFDLPTVVLLELGLDTYKIHSGFYPVQEDHEFIRVDF